MEGIFRLSGSAKRIKELQLAFDTPDRYGKGLVWEGYTVHDAANILRRYLNNLPQPIVPWDSYERFRDPLRSHQAQATGGVANQVPDVGEFDLNAAITTFQKLITEMPPLNRQLLLYILDLLAVFSSKSEQNRMTSANLAAIFQPGILSHPNHDMKPHEYRLSQDVLIFLIENQDSFLVGMSGTEADEKTVKEVQSGVQRQPNTPTKQAGLGRSASNASGGADSLRKTGGLRRNVSVSSRNSNLSSNLPSPASPAPGSPLVSTSSGSGVHRSNTLPSKKSPALAQSRFAKPGGQEPATPTSSKLFPGVIPARTSSPGSKLVQTNEETTPISGVSPSAPSFERSPALAPVPESSVTKDIRREIPSNEQLRLRTPEQGVTTTITAGSTPTRDRKHMFSKSPSSESERKDTRQPNKLKKKSRASGTSKNASAQSSTQSLHETPDTPTGPALAAPTAEPGIGNQTLTSQSVSVPPTISNTDASPSSELPPRIGEIDKMSSFHVSQHSGSPITSPALRPVNSPVPSVHSKSAAEESEIDGIVANDGKKRKGRWRLSSSIKDRNDARAATPSNSRLGSNAVAEKSTASVISQGKPRKSMTDDSQQTVTATTASAQIGAPASSNDSTPSKDKVVREKDGIQEDKEKKGPIGWIKAKIAAGKEERKEREAEKERAKSPSRASEHATSKQSLGATVQETTLSGSQSREALAEVSPEKPVNDAPSANP